MVQIVPLGALIIQYSMINGIWGLPLSNFVTACIHYITSWTLNSIRCKTGIIIIHTSPLSGLNWNNTCKVLKSSSFIVTCSFPCFLDNLKMYGSRLAISHFPYVTFFFSEIWWFVLRENLKVCPLIFLQSAFILMVLILMTWWKNLCWVYGWWWVEDLPSHRILIQ